MRRELHVGLLVSMHVVLVIASVFVMDWVIRGRSSADLWAVSHCTELICRSRPLDDAHATTVIWQTLLFSSLVIWQGGARALGIVGHRGVTVVAFMVGTVGVMSVMLMAAVFARTSGLTVAPLVLGVAYVLGFVALYAAVRADEAPLARARQVDSARASRRA
jgi:hypothetical protein